MEDINVPEKKKRGSIFKKYFTPGSLILSVILIAATVLRFHKLTFQSLWFDELQTMVECDPKLSLSQLISELHSGDYVHPPLYFLLEHFFMLIFGYSDWSARALSALGGVLSVWAIYLLGKEIKNEKLGLSAASLMCVNYFNIYYSQEARMYSFLCLFTTLSYLFFLRICKHLKVQDAILFIITTSCLIYTQYFGAFVIISELVLAVFFLLQEKEKRIKLFTTLLICELVIFMTYIPWLSQLKVMAGIHSFWIPPITSNIFIDFFNEYFYFSDTITWIIVFCWVIYLIKVFAKIKGIKNLKANPDSLSFIFVIISLIISLGIPYLRSVLVVPMLVSRYTIIVLPTLIISIACGIEAIPKNVIRYPLLCLFLWFSIRHLIIGKKYYNTTTKIQYRELAKYVTSDKANYTLIHEMQPSVLRYYLKKDGFKGQLLTGKKEDIIDSILQKSSKKYDIDTFWLIGVFADAPLSPQKQKDLDTSYIMTKDSTFIGGWAQQYIYAGNTIARTIDYQFFDTSQMFNDGKKVVAIWSKDVMSKPIDLPKGKYYIAVVSRGTPAQGIFPHNNVYINGDKIGDFYSRDQYNRHTFVYDLKNDTPAIIKIDMDNDAVIGKEDRNTFIRNIYITKGKE